MNRDWERDHEDSHPVLVVTKGTSLPRPEHVFEEIGHHFVRIPYERVERANWRFQDQAGADAFKARYKDYLA